MKRYGPCIRPTCTGLLHLHYSIWEQLAVIVIEKTYIFHTVQSVDFKETGLGATKLGLRV